MLGGGLDNRVAEVEVELGQMSGLSERSFRNEFGRQERVSVVLLHVQKDLGAVLAEEDGDFLQELHRVEAGSVSKERLFLVDGGYFDAVSPLDDLAGRRDRQVLPLSWGEDEPDTAVYRADRDVDVVIIEVGVGASDAGDLQPSGVGRAEDLIHYADLGGVEVHVALRSVPVLLADARAVLAGAVRTGDVRTRIRIGVMVAAGDQERGGDDRQQEVTHDSLLMTNTSWFRSLSPDVGQHSLDCGVHQSNLLPIEGTIEGTIVGTIVKENIYFSKN